MKTYYNNLSDFIKALKDANEIKIIEHSVSSHLEISKITDAESKSPKGGKALYFKNVKGSPFPVATNLFGSTRRISMALGVENLDQLGARIKQLIETSPPKKLKDFVELLPLAFSLTRFFPRNTRQKTPPCQQVVKTGKNVDLSEIPVLHCWPKDAGPFVTLPMVFTKSLETGKRNVGMYRLQIFDKNTTGMHWQIHKDGSHYYHEYRKAKKRMPVAVAIGADPASIYAATAPMPRNVDEMMLAGFIRNRPVSMAKCLTIDMEVPSEAEFVLEGYVDPDELRSEGPFGDHTGYYSLADDYPVFHVTAVTHRHFPVYCATLVGPPPMEDGYLGWATERIFLPMLQMIFPEIVDYYLPWEGAFHNIAIVSVRKEFPKQAQKVMFGLWGQSQMSYCKTIVTVDEDIDPKNTHQVVEKLLTTMELSSDLIRTQGVLDVLDHSSPTPIFGGKLGIDITERFPGEPGRSFKDDNTKQQPVLPEKLLEIINLSCDGVIALQPLKLPSGYDVKNMRNHILFIAVKKERDRGGAYFADKLLQGDVEIPFNILLLFDDHVDLLNYSYLMWKLFNNVDPERDIYIHKGRCVVDACKKGPADGHLREWPEELSFD